MKIFNTRIPTKITFNKVEEGEAFFLGSYADYPYIRVRSVIVDDGKVVMNAVNVSSGELMDVHDDEEVTLLPNAIFVTNPSKELRDEYLEELKTYG